MVGSKRSMSRRLVEWYRRHRRDLPWRVPLDAPPNARPDPYHVLVSEAMLQQTQVATVIPYFNRFVQTLPTIRHLADADSQQVLRLWQGLGYYSRARNLGAAAQVVVREFGGAVPRDLPDLLKLPGVGRYTAGAIASLAFGLPAPIVDGNVARVLCRIDRIDADAREKPVAEQLWRRAGELVPPDAPGEFNSALMELGATICTPRAPKCLLCPIRSHCAAQADGVQEQIPRPRQRPASPLLRRRTLCIRRRINGHAEQWLIEQRPASGRWAGMWQFITRPAGSTKTHRHGCSTTRPRKLATIAHGLTHRRYQFDVYLCELRLPDEPATKTSADGRRWVSLIELDRLPLPRPHLKIAELLAGL